MIISYEPLWLLLDTRKISKTKFRAEVKLGSSTYTKLVNGECVMTDTLLKICQYLNCNIADIMECVEE